METLEQSTEVLAHQQIEDKITRIAWQLYEAHHNEKELVLAGIANRGYVLAKLLHKELTEISALKVSLCALHLDKNNLQKGTYGLEPNQASLKNKCIVVVDDVLNSGATLIYGVKYFLDFDVKRICTVVLVDRNHKNYPVKADYKGLSLSTSLREHVAVHIERQPYSVLVS